MKKVLFSSIALICLSCFCCNLSYAANVSQSELKKIETEAKQRALESKELRAKAMQLNLELSKIDKNVVSLAKQIQENEKKLSQMEESLDKLKEDLKVKEALFIKENSSLVQTIAALQNISLNPSESVILQPISPIDIIRSAILLRETIPFLNNKSAKLKTDLESIYEQKRKIENSVKDNQNQNKLLEKQQADMRQLISKKTSMRKEFEDKSVKTQKIADELVSKAKDLRELLEELERQKEIARKKREEEERIARLKQQAELQGKNVQIAHTVDSKTHASIKQQAKGSNFARAKGHLFRPVSGNKIIEYGQTISNGVTAKGITYKTRANAQVISLYDGTVIFSGPFKGYGNIIIVEHGDGYLSLLAGLGKIDCDVGQTLVPGEPIGTMPNNNSAKLYVEIRKDRHPINPSPWIAN